MTYTELIDEVLRFTAVEGQKPIPENDERLIERIKSLGGNELIIPQAFAKLLDDKYVENPDNPKEYRISYSGLVFNEQNGYAGELEFSNAMKQKVENINQATLDNSTNLNRLTLLLVLATGLLALCEIVSFFLTNSPH